LREAFVSIVREMRVTLVRTAYSSILYEGRISPACSWTASPDRGHVQGQTTAAHRAHRLVDARGPREVWRRHPPGDVFLHNDPYTGGTHLNDVAMITPLFAPGAHGADELFVFPWCGRTGATSAA